MVHFGSAAISLLLSAAWNGSPFDILVIDHRLQDMSGWSLVDEVFENPDLSETAMIVLGSAASTINRSRPEKLERCCYVVKPATDDVLLEAIKDTRAA
jgi:CheY-like chemotaxis protein